MCSMGGIAVLYLYMLLEGARTSGSTSPPPQPDLRPFLGQDQEVPSHHAVDPARIMGTSLPAEEERLTVKQSQTFLLEPRAR